MAVPVELASPACNHTREFAHPNSAAVNRSELDLDGLAGGLQRLEAELDADGDFLANQVFGYSP